MTFRRVPALVLLVLATGLAGTAGAAVYAAVASDAEPEVRQVTVTSATPASSVDALPVADVYRRTHRGVVEITVSVGSESPPQGGQRGQGSGFVYDRDGHIVTNQHVVDGASSISVTFWNGETRAAELVGTDASTDLAVIEVDAPRSLFHPLTLSDSGKLAVGDAVVALGSPFGLEGTLTSGVVSALHRSMRAPNEFTINDSIQTDAAINHGNSGGPLLDLRGRVVGVNAQIESESGGNDGVGFAIPSNTVRSIVSQLLGDGMVEHAYLGVSVETIPASVASELRSAAGVSITEVRTASPAARAGLRAANGTETVDGQSYPSGGDVVTAVDGKAVSQAQDLQLAIDAKRPGETVTLTYVRDGRTATVEVELGNRPA